MVSAEPLTGNGLQDITQKDIENTPIQFGVIDNVTGEVTRDADIPSLTILSILRTTAIYPRPQDNMCKGTSKDCLQIREPKYRATTLKHLFLIRDGIARMLEREKGRILASVIVPPQKLCQEANNRPGHCKEESPPPQSAPIAEPTGWVDLKPPKTKANKCRLRINFASEKDFTQYENECGKMPRERVKVQEHSTDQPSTSRVIAGSGTPGTACLFITHGRIVQSKPLVGGPLWSKLWQSDTDLTSRIEQRLPPEPSLPGAYPKSSLTKDQLEKVLLRLNDQPGQVVETVMTGKVQSFPPSSVELSEICRRAAETKAARRDFAYGVRLIHCEDRTVRGEPVCKASPATPVAATEAVPPGEPPQPRQQPTPPPLVDDLTLTAFGERRAIKVSAGLDNRNSRYTGAWAGDLGLEANFPPLTSWDSGARVESRVKRSLESDRLLAWDVAGDLWALDGKLTLSHSHSNALPGGTLRDLSLNSDNDTYGIYLSHSWLRGRETNLGWRAGFDTLNSRTTVSDNTLVEDRVRSARIGVTYDRVSSLNTAYMLDTEFSRGIKIFNATESGYLYHSREQGRTEFAKLKQTFTAVAPLFRSGNVLFDPTLQFAASGQMAFTPLLVSEQFSLGGKDFGRAYDPAEMTGDHGVAGLLELRFTVDPGIPFVRDAQPYVFGDIGQIWQRARGRDIPNEKAGSVGFGLRLNAGGFLPGIPESIDPSVSLSLDVQAAHPLMRPVKTVDSSDREFRPFLQSSLRKEF